MPIIIARAELFRLNIPDFPIITCPRYDFYGKVGESASLTCEVRANPSSYIHWEIGDARRAASLAENSTGDGNMHVTRKVSLKNISRKIKAYSFILCIFLLDFNSIKNITFL